MLAYFVFFFISWNASTPFCRKLTCVFSFNENSLYTTIYKSNISTITKENHMKTMSHINFNQDTFCVCIPNLCLFYYSFRHIFIILLNSYIYKKILKKRIIYAWNVRKMRYCCIQIYFDNFIPDWQILCVSIVLWSFCEYLYQKNRGEFHVW